MSDISNETTGNETQSEARSAVQDFKNAEQRAAALLAAQRQNIVDQIKDDLRSECEAAKQELPLREAACASAQTFLADLARSDGTVPYFVAREASEMASISHNGTRAVRDALARYESLEWQDIATSDYRNQLKDFTHSVRVGLNNWKGARERLAMLQKQIETMLREATR
jgi:hypothetical protein